MGRVDSSNDPSLDESEPPRDPLGSPGAPLAECAGGVRAMPLPEDI